MRPAEKEVWCLWTGHPNGCWCFQILLRAVYQGSRFFTSVSPDKIIIVIGNCKSNWSIPVDNTEFLKRDISHQSLQHLTKSNIDFQLCSLSEITRNSYLRCQQDWQAVGTALPMTPMSPTSGTSVSQGYPGMSAGDGFSQGQPSHPLKPDVSNRYLASRKKKSDTDLIETPGKSVSVIFFLVK